MPVSHLTAFTAEVLKLYPTFSCLVSISYFDTEQNPEGKWSDNPAACKLMKPFWENQSRGKLDMIDCSWLCAQSSVLKHAGFLFFFFPLEKSPSRAYSSFSDCDFKTWWSRSLHDFKRQKLLFLSLSIKKSPADVGWADDSQWHYVFWVF